MGYHKAIKKLLGQSYRESNHYACQEAGVYTFDNLVNNIKIRFLFRLHMRPCRFIKKIWNFLYLSSEFVRDVNDIAYDKYNIHNLLENDIDAINSRILYVQNHEAQMGDQSTFV